MSKIEVDAITEQSGSTLTTGGGAGKTVVVDATTVTLGRCGGTVALASGATQSGFGRSGSVNWQTTPKTSTFTAVNGEGYFVNTSGGAVTANLPAGSAGAIVSFADYTRTFTSNNLTVAANGSEKIGGVADTLVLGVNGQALTLVYVDSTEGWINVQNAEDTETGTVAAYITATGGTISTIGDFKYHKFTGPGTFTVTCAGNAKGSNTVQALVVGGGGAGLYNGGGGGGAGGLRNLACQPVTATGFPITVGGGGPGGSATCRPAGSNSIFSTITSAGGGQGGNNSGGTGGNGGSGGGGGGNGGNAATGGTGNTPPVSPPQGNNGGSHSANPNFNAGSGGGGHGGAGAAGPNNGSPGTPGGHGGNGTDVSPSFPAPLGGSPAGFYAGGGGGGANDDGPGTASNTPNAPGGGGAGSGGGPTTGGNGTDNTGGGGGGSPTGGGGGSGSGGSGIVIIKYKFQN